MNRTRRDHSISVDPIATRRAEELLLKRYAATQDPALRDELVECFMPLARSLARRYREGSEPMEDLYQVASVGLIKAIERYDPDRPSGFAAFASPTILGELRHYFRDQTWSLRLPRGLQERSARVGDVTKDLSHELRRSPTPAEVADRSDLSTGEVVEAQQADQARRTVSLDMPAKRGEEESAPMIETIATLEPGYERSEAQIASDSAGLREQERQALHLRFHEGLTQREIGLRIGVSQMQVSRLLRRSLNKLLVAVRGGSGGSQLQPVEELAEQEETRRTMEMV